MAQRESNSTGRTVLAPSQPASSAQRPPVGLDSLGDEDLVRRTTGGDPDAYAVLVERYQSRVYNLLARMCGSQEEAEDLAQDTFMQAYRALSSFKLGSKFYTWLFRIAVNKGLSRRRQDVRRRAHEGGRLDAPAAGTEEQTLGAIIAERDPSDPAKQMDRELVRQRVREGLNQIDPDYRTILVLRDMDGLDYDAIAETLEITRAAVKSRLHRARLEMARILKDLKPQ